MLLTLPNVLTPEQTATVRGLVEQAELGDGRLTGSARLKLNRQSGGLAPGLEPAQKIIHEAMVTSPDFSTFALPRHYRIFFNRYDVGMYYKAHMDMALMGIGTPQLLRTDLSFTVFLSDPADYEGGDFRIETPFGEQRQRHAPGTLICYPSDMLHEVLPVTRGSRLAAIGWIQSLMPDPRHRELFRAFDQVGRDMLKLLPEPEPYRERLGRIREGLLRHFSKV